MQRNSAQNFFKKGNFSINDKLILEKSKDLVNFYLSKINLGAAYKRASQNAHF